MGSLEAFRVVVLHGARQTGKTTSARLVAERRGAGYVSLDRADDLAAAAYDPPTFLESLGTPLVIDEVQRVGDPLVLAIKVVVDADPRPGQYLLTGSTNFLTVPSISETLAGRVDIVPLWPLSEGELGGGADSFIDRVFESPERLTARRSTPPGRQEYLEIVCRGGYPSVQRMPAAQRRRWFTQYVRTVLQREVQVAADIRRGNALRTMIRYLASITAQELVVSTMASRLGIDRQTANTYEPWLETVFLAHRVPAWSRNITSKVVRRPKVYMSDTGIAAALLGKDPAALARVTEPATGQLLETLVANELAKQADWSSTPAQLHHLRDSDGAEVDLLLEADDGRVVGAEVKATSTPRTEDFRWLAHLRDRLDRIGQDFRCGVVLHTGDRRMRYGDRLLALPIADIWN